MGITVEGEPLPGERESWNKKQENTRVHPIPQSDLNDWMKACGTFTNFFMFGFILFLLSSIVIGIVMSLRILDGTFTMLGGLGLTVMIIMSVGSLWGYKLIYWHRACSVARARVYQKHGLDPRIVSFPGDDDVLPQIMVVVPDHRNAP